MRLALVQRRISCALNLGIRRRVGYHLGAPTPLLPRAGIVTGYRVGNARVSNFLRVVQTGSGTNTAFYTAGAGRNSFYRGLSGQSVKLITHKLVPRLRK
jgi:hypothetical protein